MGDEDIENDSDAAEDAIMQRLNRRTFVVASRNLLAQPQWVSVSEAFRTSDTEILEKAGIIGEQEKFDQMMSVLHDAQETLNRA